MKTVINFKIDKEVKEEAQQLARELGMTLSAIVNAQLRELLRTRELSLNAEPRMSSYLEKIIEDVEQDRLASKNITRTKSLEDALAHLDSL